MAPVYLGKIHTLWHFDFLTKSIKKSQSALGLSTNQLFIEQQASARGKYRNICAKNHATFLINTMIAARGNNWYSQHQNIDIAEI
jgi:hypothetical protein